MLVTGSCVGSFPRFRREFVAGSRGSPVSGSEVRIAASATAANKAATLMAIKDLTMIFPSKVVPSKLVAAHSLRVGGRRDVRRVVNGGVMGGAIVSLGFHNEILGGDPHLAVHADPLGVDLNFVNDRWLSIDHVTAAALAHHLDRLAVVDQILDRYIHRIPLATRHLNV